MVSYWKLFLYFSIITETMETGIFISSNIIKQFVLKNVTKHWFSYLKALLVKVTDLKLNISNTQNIINVFRMFCEGVMSFHMKITSNRNSTLRHSVFTDQYKLNTLFPTGIAEIQGTYVKDIGCLQWQFQVSRYLKINLTVDYLNIPASYIGTCYIGEFRLFDSSQQISTKCTSAIHDFRYVANNKYRYCGIHSAILFYFRGLFQYGYIRSFSLMNYHISMRYSVMDSLYISMWTNQDYLLQPQRYTLLLQDDKIIASFLIQVSKLHIVQLSIKPINIILEIYDGPGTFSPKMNKDILNNAILQSTTFQVYLFSETRIYHTITGLSVASVTKQDHQMLVNLVPGRHTLLKYPHSNMCNLSTFCTTYIRTSLYFFINITTEAFMYSGYNIVTCPFGGFSVYDFLNDTYQEMTTICTNQGENYLHRNIYSSTESAILIFYFYDGYDSRMGVQLNVSTTKCRRIIVNACKYTYE